MNDNDNSKEIGAQASGETTPIVSTATPISNDTGRPADPFATVGEPPHMPKKNRWHWIWIGILGLLVAWTVLNLAIEFFWTGGPIEASHVDRNHFAVSDVSRLSTDLSTIRTHVRTHGGDDIIVHFDAPSRGRYMRPRWNLNADGTLHIYSESPSWLGNFRFLNIPLNAGGVLNIYLPAGMAEPLESFNLRTSTGRIELDARLHIANDLRIQTSTGRIEASGFSANSVELRASTGRIEANNIDAAGNIDINTSTGRVEARHLAAGSLRISTSTGRAEATHITADTVNISTSTGRIVMDLIEAERLDASATTGRIELSRSNILGDTVLNTSTGRIEISGGSIGGWLSVRTTTGRIELSGVDVDMNRVTLSTNTGRIRTN